MDKYIATNVCVEKYLKKQLKHYREIAAIHIFIVVISQLLLGIILLPLTLVFYGDCSNVCKILIVIVDTVSFLAFGGIIYNWDSGGATRSLLNSYARSRFVWRDSAGSDIKGKGEEKFYFALAQAAVNSCGERDLLGRIMPYYDVSEQYIKENITFLEIVWKKYNCDREIRRELDLIDPECIKQIIERSTRNTR